MCKKCKAHPNKIFFNPWSKYGYHQCTVCGHGWNTRTPKEGEK